MAPRGQVQVPQDLQTVPEAALESYVRSRIMQVAGSHLLADRLRLTPSLVQQAVADVMASESPHTLRALPSEPSELQLFFRHDCLSLGCLEPGCQLCAQNPHRRCEGNFANKYLAGDVLKAKCGASIRLEVIDRRTGDPLKDSDLEGVQLEMCIVDGRAYQGLAESGREQYDDEVDACILLLNNQHKELLSPGRGGMHTEDKKVVVQMSRSQAHLPDLTVTGSSEAILSGQKPPFRLLVRAVRGQDGTRLAHIRFAVSEAFVVATPRVRTAVKAEIPHMEDHVSKLQAVGVQTQQKLQDIQAAAKGVGIFNLKLPINKVNKVGEFRDLVELAEKDRPLCENLKRVLRLTRGWETARDHALQAVGTDNFLRIWYSDASMTNGLLFKCLLGSVDLNAPLGLIQKGEDSSAAVPASMDIILTQNLTPDQKDLFRRLQRKALICWWQHRHPGWTIWHIDSEAYQRGNPAEMRAVMAQSANAAQQPQVDAFGSFPSDGGLSGLTGSASQLGSGLGIADLSHTSQRGGSGAIGGEALPGGFNPPARGDSGQYPTLTSGAHSGLYDIAHRANSSTDIGRQIAEANVSASLVPNSGPMPFPFGNSGELVNTQMREASGALPLNGYDIHGAPGQSQELQPSRASDPLPLDSPLGLVTYCAPQGSLYASAAQSQQPISMDMPSSSGGVQGMTMGAMHIPGQPRRPPIDQQHRSFVQDPGPRPQPQVSWGAMPFASQPGDVGIRRHSSGKQKAQAPLSPFGNMDQQNAEEWSSTTTSGRTFHQDRPQLGAGHKRRLSEAGLKAVSGLMGRHLTPREFETLEKKNWQPEPGLSYSPSGLPFTASGLGISGLNSEDLHVQIQQDLQQPLPASRPTAASSQPGMAQIPNPKSEPLGSSISQIFAGMPSSTFGAQLQGGNAMANPGQDAPLPLRPSFMNNFDGIDANDLNDAVAMLHDMGASSLDLPRESSAFLDQLYKAAGTVDSGQSNPMPPPPAPGHPNPAHLPAPAPGPHSGRMLKRGLSGLGASHRSDGLESMQSIEDALNEEERLRQL